MGTSSPNKQDNKKGTKEIPEIANDNFKKMPLNPANPSADTKLKQKELKDEQPDRQFDNGKTPPASKDSSKPNGTESKDKTAKK